jgi:hypothetical protein
VTCSGSTQFAAFLDHVTRLADPFIDNAGFAKADEVAALLPAIEQVINTFVRIRKLLLEQTTKC